MNCSPEPVPYQLVVLVKETPPTGYKRHGNDGLCSFVSSKFSIPYCRHHQSLIHHHNHPQRGHSPVHLHVALTWHSINNNILLMMLFLMICWQHILQNIFYFCWVNQNSTWSTKKWKNGKSEFQQIWAAARTLKKWNLLMGLSTKFVNEVCKINKQTWFAGTL